MCSRRIPKNGSQAHCRKNPFFAHDRCCKHCNHLGTSQGRCGRFIRCIAFSHTAFRHSRCLRYIPDKNILALSADGLLPLSILNSRMADLDVSNHPGSDHLHRCVSYKKNAFFICGMVLVSGNARARYRSGSGGETGDSRPLHVFAVHRHLHHAGLEPPSFI